MDLLKIFNGLLSESDFDYVSSILPKQMIGPTICEQNGEEFIVLLFQQLQKINFRTILLARSDAHSHNTKNFKFVRDILEALILFCADSVCANALTSTLGSTLLTPLDLLLRILNDCMKAANKMEGRALRALFTRGLTMGSLVSGGEVEAEKNLESKHPYSVGQTSFMKKLHSPRQDIIDSTELFDESFGSDDEEQTTTVPDFEMNAKANKIMSISQNRTAIKIWFDRKTKTRSNDHVRLFADAKCTHLLAQFSGSVLGRKRGGWPLLEDPLILLVNSGGVYVQFVSQIAAEDTDKSPSQILWGWRIFAIMTEDPYQLCQRHRDTVVVSYTGVRSRKIVIPDATALQIMFRSDSHIGDADVIYFTKSNSKKLYGKGKYSGSVASRSLPGFDSPIIIDSDKVNVTFTCMQKYTNFELLISPVEVKKKSKCVTILEHLALLLSRVIHHSDVPRMLEMKGDITRGMLPPMESAIATLADNSEAVNLFQDVIKKILTVPLLLKAEIKECMEGNYTDQQAMQLLLAVLSILSSPPSEVRQPLFTDISPVPFLRQPFSRDVSFPLADRIEVSFEAGASLPHNTMLTVHGDPSSPHDTKVFYSSTKQWESFIFMGGNLNISFSLYASDEENESMGDLDMSSQYCLHVPPIYDDCFQRQGWAYFQQVGGLENCFPLIMKGLESPDEITSVHAARVLSNLLFSPPVTATATTSDPTKDQDQEDRTPGIPTPFYNRALRRLSLLFKDDSSVMSIFNLCNMGNVPISLCNSLLVAPARITDFKARRNIFFEVTCSQNSARIGLMVPLEYRLNSEYLPTSLKNASVFGTETSQNCFYLDLAARHLVWGSQKRRVDIPNIQKGDVLGVQLDIQLFQITFSLNGQSIVDGPCFEGATHGGADLWTCGFQPAIWIDKGVGTPFLFNFGQHKFDFPPKVRHRCYSMLEIVRKTPPPSRKKDEVTWQHNVWSIHDGSTASGYRPVHDEDSVFVHKRDAYVTEKRQKLNFRRQIARGLSGASPLDRDAISVAIDLAKSSDITTRNWAIKCLLHTLHEGLGRCHQLIIDDPVVLQLVLEACTNTAHPDARVFFSDALDNFQNKEILFNLIHTYVFTHTAPANTKLLESEHPYSSGRKNYAAEEIYFPDAVSMEIIFDPSTRTQENSDYVCFYTVDPKGLDDSRRLFYRIGQRYSGTEAADWPSLFSPLRLPYNRVWVTFSTDDHIQFWGYRFIATGKKENMLAPYATLVQQSGMQEFESQHPYMKESSVTSRITLPGKSTTCFQIAFDARTHLNLSPTGTTSLTFYRRNPKLRGDVKYPISYKFTGVAFPGMNGMAPLIIELDNEATDIDYNRNNRTIWYHFETDDSAVGWGWRFVITPCVPPADPLQAVLDQHPEGMVVETNHPCLSIDRTSTPTIQKDYLFRRNVYYPGADSIAIVFDPRSETRLDNTHRPDMMVSDEKDAASFLEMVLLVKCFLTDEDLDPSQPKRDKGLSQGLRAKNEKSTSKQQYSLEDLPTMSKWVDGKTWMYGGGLGGKVDLMKANFPTSPSQPLIIPTNHFFFTFASVYHNDCVQWGVRCFTYPLYNRPQKSLVFDRLCAVEGAVLITDETARVGKDGRVRIKLPDTQLLQICFDGEETGCFNEDRDFLVKVFSGRPPKRIRTQMEESKQVGVFRCTSGRRFFPGVDGYPPLVLNKPNLWLDVVQPSEKGYKGSYTLVVAPYEDELATWVSGGGEIIDMVHPYTTPSKKTFLYESHTDDQWMELAFDQRTSLGPNASVTFSSRHSCMSEFIKWSGTQMEGNFPTTQHPARIASAACVLSFVSTELASLASYWGFRVAIRPLAALDPADTEPRHLKSFPLEKSLFDITYRSIEYKHMKLSIQSTIFELIYLLTRENSNSHSSNNDHDTGVPLEASRMRRYVESERMEGVYLPNAHMEGSITFPLAQKLQVTFSPLTHTEKDSDAVNLYGARSMRDEDYLKYYNEVKREESIAMFSGLFSRIGHWGDMLVPQDRLFFSFSSEAVLDPMWGFKMFVSPIYSVINTPPVDLLDSLVSDKSVFRMLESQQQMNESASVGLVLANILLSEKTRDDCVSLYGVEWFNNLLLRGSDDVIIVTLNALLSKQEPYAPCRSGLNFIATNKCVPTIIKLLGHDNIEIKAVSLMFLNALFNPPPPNSDTLNIDTSGDDLYSVESVLLDIVGTGSIDELRHASDIVSKLLLSKKVDPSTMKGSKENESFGERLMRQMKHIFVEGSKEKSRLEVAFTLCTLMDTENGIADFLGRSSGDHFLKSKSTECLNEILKMLASSVVEKAKDHKTKICLQFLKKLCDKAAFKTVCHHFYRKSNGCISLLPNSFQVQREMRPLWLDLTSPVDTLASSSSSSTPSAHAHAVMTSPLASPGGRKSGGGFSSKFKNASAKKKETSSSSLSDDNTEGSFLVGFWMWPSGFIDRDGLPIFFKGDFSGVIAPPHDRTSFRVLNSIRHARVYYEVTLNSFSQPGKGCVVSVFCVCLRAFVDACVY